MAYGHPPMWKLKHADILPMTQSLSIQTIVVYGQIFPLSMHLGIICQQSSGQKAWRLHCKDPCIIDNYVKSYSKYIRKSNLLHKVKLLKEISTYPMTEEDKQVYEDYDLLRCKGLQLAEKKCRKLHKGQVAFSLQFQSASLRINAWSLF